MRQWWWLPLLLAASGCGESVEEYIAARRAMAEAQLAKVARVRDLAIAQPPGEWATMRDPGPMAICDLVITPYRTEGCDTWVMDLEQLKHPDAYLDPRPLVRFGEEEWLVLTTSLLRTGRFPPNASYPSGAEVDRLTRPVTYAFEWLERARYLIVVRRDELVPPVLAEDQKSYEAGRFRGEAMLFSLAPEPEALGSVPFAYAMQGELKVKMRGGVIRKADVDGAFARGVRQALADELVTRLGHLERPPQVRGPRPLEDAP